MNSINSLSLCSFSNLQNPKLCKFILHRLSNSLKPPLPSLTYQNHKHPKLQITIQREPSSIPSLVSQKTLNLCLSGLFIFMGMFGFNAKPTLALVNKVSCEKVEENRDTQMEKSEEEERYEKILEREPGNFEALKVVVHGMMRRGEIKLALKYVERLVDIQPEEVEWRLLEAHCYELIGNFSRAKKLFREILKEKPLLLRALHGLALVMHKNLEGPAVFEMLNKALELARREKRVTEERNIRILTAQMHVVKGQLEEGLKQFQALVNENPRDFRPYLCQGIIYSLMDKKKEAAEQFEIYQSLVPEEFAQRQFLDDVMLLAKSKSHERLRKDFDAEFSYAR